MGNLLEKNVLPVMNTFGLTKDRAKKLLKIAKATGLSIAKLQPSAPIIRMMVSGDPDALKHHVKWCKLTKKEYKKDPSKWWPPEGPLIHLQLMHCLICFLKGLIVGGLNV